MATRSIPIEPVVKAVTVACTPEAAFRYFTAEFGMWWPSVTHSVVAYASAFKDKPAAVLLEPGVGGRILERTHAGGEHLWGRVLEWQPPTRLTFSFHPGRDEKQAQTVEVTFSIAAEGTKVVLTHRDWEKLNANAQQARDDYNRGWEGVFVTTFPAYIVGRISTVPTAD